MSDPFWAYWWVCEAGAVVLLLFSMFGPMRHAEQHSRAGRRFSRQADAAYARGDYPALRENVEFATHEYDLAKPFHHLARRLNYTALAMTWSLILIEIVRAIVF